MSRVIQWPPGPDEDVIETQILAVPAQNLTLSGLDGDADGMYELFGHGTLGGSGFATLSLNGSIAAAGGQTMYSESAGVYAAVGGIAWGGGAATAHGFRALIFPRRGQQRGFVSSVWGAGWTFRSGAYYPDGALVTSLVINGPAADFFSAGYRLKLRRLRW